MELEVWPFFFPLRVKRERFDCEKKKNQRRQEDT